MCSSFAMKPGPDSSSRVQTNLNAITNVNSCFPEKWYYSVRDNLSLRKDIGTFHHILFLSKIWCHNWFLIHRIFSEKKISISAFPRDWADVEPVFHLKERIFFKKENAVMLSFHFIFIVNILSFSWLLRMRSCPSVVISTVLSYILTSYQSWWTRLMTTLIWCSVFHQSTVHLNGNLFIWF